MALKLSHFNLSKVKTPSSLAGLLMLLFFFAVSCTPSKTAYFENIPDTAFPGRTDGGEIKLDKNDILNIDITSLNAEASAIFNRGLSATVAANTAAANNRSQNNGYLVDYDGFIQLPLLGKVKAAGLTRRELSKSIVDMILQKKLLIEPIVDVRQLNYEVTVVGEVGRPTVISVPNEKISLLKALGLAGDLTIYGRRDNILVIREEDGVKKTKHIDINDQKFITSDYYYLQPNDVVYVEPNKAKAISGSLSRQILPSVLSGLSLLVLVLTRLNL